MACVTLFSFSLDAIAVLTFKVSLSDKKEVCNKDLFGLTFCLHVPENALDIQERSTLQVIAIPLMTTSFLLPRWQFFKRVTVIYTDDNTLTGEIWGVCWTTDDYELM